MNYMLCLGALAWWIMGLFIDGAGEGSFVFWGTVESKGPVRTYCDPLEKSRSVPMQSHLGSVVLCLISTCVVGFKVLQNFYANCRDSVQSLQSVKLIYQPCSRSRAAWTLTWLIKLKDGIKSFSGYFLWHCWVPTISVLTLAYCCSEGECVRSILKMMLSSRRTQPPVVCMWSLKPSFPG